jgi:tricorn protease
MKTSQFLILCLAGLSVSAMAENTVKQGPFIINGLTMNQDKVVFATAGKLWQVDRKGGQAKAITKGSADDAYPHFSPDGSQIAFLRHAQGNRDVYTLNLKSNRTKRLTYHPAADWPVSWHPDGTRVNLVSRRGMSNNSLYQVAIEQGFATPLPAKYGDSMNYRNDGTIAFVPLSHNPSMGSFRYYRGGMRAQIHIVKPTDNHHWQPVRKITAKNANVYSPQWLDTTLYYVSDEDGTANLYRNDNDKIQQLTHFKRYGVRAFDVDENGFIILQDGFLHTGELDSNQVNKLAVSVPSSDKLKRTRRIDATRNISELSLTNNANQYAIVARGDVFLANSATGKSENLTKTAGSAEHSAVVSPNEKYVAYFSDASGQYQLAIQSLHDNSPTQHFAIEQNPSFYHNLTWSPDSTKLNFDDNRLSLWVFELANQQFNKVAKSKFSGQNRYDVSWSNDSNLLAYGLIDAYGLSRIHVYHSDKKSSQALSPKGQYANAPLFDKNGRYLYYYTSPNANATNYEWGILNGMNQTAHRTTRLKAVVLNKGDQPPILPGLDLPNLKANLKDIKAKVSIDYNELSSRTVTLKIGNHNITRLSTSAPGKIQIVTQTLPVPLRLDSHRIYHLHQLDLRNPTALTNLFENFTDLRFSSDGQRSTYKKANKTYIAQLSKPKSLPKSMPTFTLFKSLEPMEEWQQMFRESFNYMIEQLYDPNMHGNDPQRLYQEYARYLPNITSRKELQDLTKRIMGFVSVSHTQVKHGDAGPGNSGRENIGLLGADYQINNGRYQFTKVYRNTSSENSSFAPLDQLGSQISEGEYLISVNNQQVTTKKNLFRYFIGSKNKVTFITVADNPKGKNARKLQVKTVANEAALRMANWAEANKQYVEKQSQGKIKYVHLNKFNHEGIEDFLTQYYALQDAKGLIIDVRFNGGGITSDALIELLSRKTLYKYRFRQGVDLSTPVNAFEGETTLIINQWNGSAAETFAQMFKTAKIGNVVGKPTFGAGIGSYAFDLTLVDGAAIQIPNRGSYMPDGNWTIENRGLHPNVDVAMDLYNDGPANDPQLNMALKKNREQTTNSIPQHWVEPVYPIHPGSDGAL